MPGWLKSFWAALALSTICMFSALTAVAGAASLDLLTQANVTLGGANASDEAGSAVASVGDVNRDGLADVIVGAPYLNCGPSCSNGGAAYVVYGKLAPAQIDLATVGGGGNAEGFRIDGAAAGDHAGLSVAGAGDVNGDGYADVIVGAPDAGTMSGSTYVIFGKLAPQNVDLATVGGGGGNAEGFRIDGAAGLDRAGYSVAGPGDVNGDGYADVIVGAPLTRNLSRPWSGSAYVVFGKQSPADVDLTGIGNGVPSDEGFRIDGAASSDQVGTSVAGAGDVNGNGRPDLVIGARYADKRSGSGCTVIIPCDDAGAAYVIFDRGGTANIDLNDLGTSGYRIDGAAAGDLAGSAVAGAGDVNSSGSADVVVGAPGADRTSGRDKATNQLCTVLNPCADTGAAFAIYGKTTPVTVDLAALGNSGFRVDGSMSPREAGNSVAGVGDVDSDGYSDIAIGAEQVDSNGRDVAGSVYVIRGGRNLPDTSVNNLDNPYATAGFQIDGAAAHDQAGHSVAGGGDFNGDGRPDVLIGANRADYNSASNSGSAYVAYGFGPPSIAYDPLTATAGRSIEPLAPRVRRTGAASFSVTPALPDGLILDSETGVVSGTPTTPQDVQIHTVTMSDMVALFYYGPATAQLAIRIDPPQEAPAMDGEQSGADDTSAQGSGRCANAVRGTRRADRLKGTAASDRITGGRGNDRIAGGAGDDCLAGQQGNDRIDGGKGGDKLDGGKGKDTLVGGKGVDRVTGGAGNDRIDSADGRRETVRCGRGKDRVRADRSDRLQRCERVRRVRR